MIESTAKEILRDNLVFLFRENRVVFFLFFFLLFLKKFEKFEDNYIPESLY
ncbi:hypothetical protein SAMN02910398_00413 [Butyrivibrio sp. YAB3001]|nr:hypothetical protein SAMN02910398_00413 [Butyrivibrio sp. YAB3001]